MPTTPFVTALRTKQKEGKFSIEALAKEIGVSSPSVSTALKGKSIPNATTIARYAKFLGISADELKAMTATAPKAKAPKAAKKSGKKSKGKAAKTVASAAGEAPGKPAKRRRKQKRRAKQTPNPAPARTGRPAKTMTLERAVQLAADDLAVAVFGASAAIRRVIAAILAS